MKVDRQEIIGLVTAIDIWLSTDHNKRLKEQDARYAALAEGLENLEVCRARSITKKTAIPFPIFTLHVVARTLHR